MIDFPEALEKLGIIQIDVWAIVIALCNLLILFLLVKKFLFKPVLRIFEERKTSVESVYKDAKEAKDAADADREYCAQMRERAEEEAEDIVRKANERAKKNGESIVKDAQKEALALKQKAERDIEQEKIKAVNEAKDEITSISVQIAEKIVGRELKEEDHKRFVDHFVSDLEKKS